MYSTKQFYKLTDSDGETGVRITQLYTELNIQGHNSIKKELTILMFGAIFQTDQVVDSPFGKGQKIDRKATRPNPLIFQHNSDIYPLI